MGKIYTDLEKGKTAKKEGVEKKKREPNEYNLFVRSEMAVLKQRVQVQKSRRRSRSLQRNKQTRRRRRLLRNNQSRRSL